MDRPRVQKQLEADEGRREEVYRDHLGYLTVGIGHLLDTRLGGKLRPAEVDFIFSNDLDEAIDDLTRTLPWFSQMNDARQGALVNMRFQLGLTKLLKFSQSLAAIRDERWEDAAHNLTQSAWASQTPTRARRVIEQIRTGEWQY